MHWKYTIKSLIKNKKIADFLKTERVFLRMGIYAIGIFLVSIGILMIVNAKVGLSGPDAYISSVCIAIGKSPTSKWYGYLIWMHYLILWLFVLSIFSIKKIIRKNKWTKKNFVYIFSMLIPVFATGPMVSLNTLWLYDLLKGNKKLWLKYMIFILGVFIAAFGGSCTIWTKILIEPHSGMVLEANDILSKKIKWIKFSYLRIALDFIFFIMAIIIGYSTKQNVFGFDPSTFNDSFPLISYSTLFFIIINGIIFDNSIKLLNKILGKSTH